MNIDPNTIDDIWLQLQGLLQPVAEQVKSSYPDISTTINRSQNDIFPLRVQLTFLRQRDGEEIAISVDFKYKDHLLKIESDICTDEGQVLIEGPSISIDGPKDKDLLNRAINEWIDKYRFFLNKQYDLLEKAMTTI